MTTDLDRLIDAVEADGPVSAHVATRAFPRKGYAHVVNASTGSLDAAAALLEALLPDWDWSAHGNGEAVLWPPGSIDQQHAGAIEPQSRASPPAPCCWRPCARIAARRRAGDGGVF